MPSTTISPEAHISEKAQFGGLAKDTSRPQRGDISVAAKAVLHPFSRVDAAAGDVEIGEAAMIWEKAVVGEVSAGIRSQNNGTDSSEAQMTTKIGKHATIEASVVVEAGAEVKEGCVIEVGARIGAGAVVGEFCTVAAGAVVAQGETVPPYTAIYFAGDGMGQQQRINVSLRDNPWLRNQRREAHEKHCAMMVNLVKPKGLRP